MIESMLSVIGDLSACIYEFSIMQARTAISFSSCKTCLMSVRYRPRIVGDLEVFA